MVSPAAVATPVNALIANAVNFQYNPTLIQSAVMQTLQDATNGTLQIVDPTNPFVFCLEAASCLTAASMIKNETNTRKQYPVAAQTPDELYLHMSDKDYINRFATPAVTTMDVLMNLKEATNKMVLDPLTGISKLVIPRNSMFTVANVNFSIQYPIEIRQLAHGGIQVVYDATIPSPLQPLTTNVIPHEIRTNTDGDYIHFQFEVMQFDIISQTGSLSSAVDFSIDIPMNDQFYFARVYVQDNLSNWVEIKTTHTDEVYDIAVPTAVIKVVSNVATVSIPQIYTATGVLNSGIRIDVYETKGILNMILWEYPLTAFTATWVALNPTDATPFVAPMSTIQNMAVYSTAVVSGGTNAKTFLDLRTQVINNATGAPNIPVTNAQIAGNLSINGYNIIKNIDNITNRVFLATKDMPMPTDQTLITPANAMMALITITLSKLLLINSVIDNGASVTITPDTIYQNVNGVVSPVNSGDLRTLLSSTNDKLAQAVSTGNYLYTPFHYVLDTHNNAFVVRPYYLDNPQVTTKLFGAQNDTTLLQVNTGSYAITRTATGYQITIVTQSGATYQALNDSDVFVQLSYIPHGERDYAYLNGTLVGKTTAGERIFTFDLSTNFNVDSTDNIQLSKFLMYTTQPRLTGSPLLNNFDIVYSTTANVGPQWVNSGVDNLLGRFILPKNVIGITHEVLRVNFGYALGTLWARSRSVISTTQYQQYPTDVPRLYENDIYQLDANGSAVTFDNAGNPVTTLLHAKGSPVLDSTGNPILLHHAGDVVMDQNGIPIVANIRDITRQLNIMLLEGAYWFANDATANNYRAQITQSIVDWLTLDLVNMDAQVLEQTNVYFYPNSTLGSIRAMIDNGIIKNIVAAQSFTVNLSVSKLVYNNLALRQQLTNSTISTIRDQLTSSVISLDAITTALKAQYGSDVISVLVSGLGGLDACSVITVLDNSNKCSIKKKLVAMPNNSLIVSEDVSVNFVLYQAN